MLFRGAPRTGNWATQKSRTGRAATWWQMAAKVSGHEKLLEHFFSFFFSYSYRLNKKKRSGGKKEKKMENGAYGQKKEMHSQIYFLFYFF